MKRIFATAALALCMSSLAGPSFAQTTGEIAKGNCKAVSAMCQKTVDYCNEKKGNYGKDSTTNAIKDCIDSAKATSAFLERGSALSSKSAEITVTACNECAKVCDQYKDDNQMTACANECRKAASNLGKVK